MSFIVINAKGITFRDGHRVFAEHSLSDIAKKFLSPEDQEVFERQECLVLHGYVERMLEGQVYADALEKLNKKERLLWQKTRKFQDVFGGDCIKFFSWLKGGAASILMELTYTGEKDAIGFEILKIIVDSFSGELRYNLVDNGVLRVEAQFNMVDKTLAEVAVHRDIFLETARCIHDLELFHDQPVSPFLIIPNNT